MTTKTRAVLIYGIIGICFTLLFVGGPDYYSSRSFKQFWNLGHVFFFALLTFILMQRWNLLKNMDLWKQLLWILPVTFLMGGVIEWAQVDFQRTSEFEDVWRNMEGAMLAIFFFSPGRKAVAPNMLKALKIGVIALIIMEIYSPLSAVFDETMAREQFPVLSDFESRPQAERWQSENAMSITSEEVHSGKYSLKVQLSTKKYSGVFLEYFPRNWEGYRILNFSVANPRPDTLMLVCRIHDAQHVRGDQRYSDRFNRRLTVCPGWNQFSISLYDIEQAPREREMDSKNIINFGLFAVELPSPRIIYIDDVYLTK